MDCLDELEGHGQAGLLGRRLDSAVGNGREGWLVVTAMASAPTAGPGDLDGKGRRPHNAAVLELEEQAIGTGRREDDVKHHLAGSHG